MFVLKNNDIKSFPFEEAATLNKVGLEEWAKDRVNLSAYNSWMLPQILGYFGNFTCTKLSDGTYDSMSLLRDNISKTKPWELGIWRVVTQLKRSSLVKSQIGTPKYSTLVPLILAGLKESKGIPYSRWTKEGLNLLLGSELHDAATATVPEVSKSRLLEIREEGLTTKTGKTVGSKKKVTSTWALTGLNHTEFAGVPKLTVTMLTQIWVAHPTLRSNLMILDPSDWDNVPEPLIPNELLDVPVSTIKYASKNEGISVEANW